MTSKRSDDRPLLPAFPSVEDRVAESTEIWARDLRSSFEHAKERFGDVSWESEEDGDISRIWGHKAVIYARAPKAFKDRYFISRPFSRSPTSLRSPSPLHSPGLFPSRASSPASSFRRPSTALQGGSSLSVQSITSDGTIRANGDGVLRLTHGDTPEMFQAQLEWLYTGEGFGDVVEWISAEDDSGIGDSLRDSLGRRGNMADRRDKLGQDLTYMWRSKLYCDVRIHLAPQDENDEASQDSDESTDSLSSTAIFTSHRFILVSRSPYFASVLLNPSAFRPNSTADIHLLTPPFTPAALHFCLGYMYAGHLDFSNRTFDLVTAFQIHRAAAYLQLDTLIQEIEARIVHDFCHGLDYVKCHCRRCCGRAARIWRFASASDVAAVDLAQRARTFLIRGWGESWGRDVGSAEGDQRASLVQEVILTITPLTIVSAVGSVEMVRMRIEAGLRAKGSNGTSWVDSLEDMLEAVETHTRHVLISKFAEVAEGAEVWDLLDGRGFAGDILEKLVKETVDGVGTVRGCVEGPRVYQTLVSAILLKVDSDSLRTILPPRSRSRQQIELAKDGVLGHIRRRWMQIRDAGGFDGLENWALKEISDGESDILIWANIAEIDIPVGELLSIPLVTPKRPSAVVVSPETAQHRLSNSSTASRSTTLSTIAGHRSSIPGALDRVAALRSRPSSPPDDSGLKRLRLSASASTSSVTSSRSVSVPRAPQRPASGPQARSPTAAKPSPTVAIGRARPSSPTPSARTLPRSMSGPPRQLIARPSPKLHQAEAISGTPLTPKSRTVKTPITPSCKPAVDSSSPTAGNKSRTVTSTMASMTSEAGPSRPRMISTSTTASSRSKAISTVSKAPSMRSVKHATSTDATLSGINTARTARSEAKGQKTTHARTTSVSTTASVRSRTTTGTSTVSTPSKLVTTPKSSQFPSSSRQSAPLRPFQLSSPSKYKRPVSPKPLSSATAARLRTASAASTISKSSIRNRHPPTAMPKPMPRASVRSPSSSTEEPPEARTPQSSQIIDPVIRREGSDGSDLARSISPTKPAPPITLPRQMRKTSTSSSRSTASAIRSHPASAFDPPKRLKETTSLLNLQITDGSKPFAGAGLAFHSGIPCIVSLSQKRARFKAQVKYIGHMLGSRGPWVGLEVEDLDRLGVPTLPSGSKEGIHYFHLTPFEEPPEQEAKSAQQRRIDVIREGMTKRSVTLFGLGLGLGRPQESRVPKRSISPMIQDWGGIERPRALFVRPSEVVFILGAE